MPDVENMVIIAEIFKITLDELLIDSGAKQSRKTPVYTSETIYDIDCEKHFDIKIGSAAKIALTSGKDEKLHIRLSSETIEDLDKMFKIRLDERKNMLDVVCLNKNKLSRYEAEESLEIEIMLPEQYTDHCEIEASAKLLAIRELHLRRLEYDGDAEQVLISNSSGSLELTAKTDFEIFVNEMNGRLDIHQWKAKAVVHIKEHMANVINKGRKFNVYYRKEGNVIEYENCADSESEISISGVFSELIVDLTE